MKIRMSRRTASAVTAVATALGCAACQRTLKPEQAAEAIRTELAPPRPQTAWTGGTSATEKLAQAGLLTYKTKPWAGFMDVSDITLTEKGKAMQLTVLPNGRGVSGRVCDHVLGKVETLRAIGDEQARAMEAEYTVVVANPSEFLTLMRSLDLVPASTCDAADVERLKAHFVMIDRRWTLNHPPAFPDATKNSVATKFSYRGGLLYGAVTTLKLETRPTDPDGDSLTFHWSLMPGDGSAADPKALTVNGLEAEWRRGVSQGELDGGVVTFAARDKWGDETTFRFCVEGYRFRC